MQYDDGSVENVQVSKPLFVRYDNKKNRPIKIIKQYKTGPKEIYVTNEEAVEEVLSMLKLMGLNKITTLTNLSERTILEDLKRFECILASVLMLKQKSWGIDKELMSMIQAKISTIVQDARYMSCNGSTLKAIQKTVQRVESYNETPQKGRGAGPYA